MPSIKFFRRNIRLAVSAFAFSSNLVSHSLLIFRLAIAIAPHNAPQLPSMFPIPSPQPSIIWCITDSAIPTLSQYAQATA